MRSVSAVTLAVTTLAILAVAAPARAEGPTDPRKARELVDDGMVALVTGSPDRACSSFAESQRLDPQPETLYFMAGCELARKRSAAALRRYQVYLEAYRRLPPDQQERFREHREYALYQVKKLPNAELTIRLPADAPPGTQVFMNGRIAPVSVPFIVSPGEYLVVAVAPGRAPIEEQVKAEAGQEPVVPLKVAPLDAAAPPVTSVAAPVPAASGSPAVGTSLMIAGGAITGVALTLGAVFTGLWVMKRSDVQTLVGQVPKNDACAPGGVTPQPNATCTSLVSALQDKTTFGGLAVGSGVAAGIGAAILAVGAVRARGTTTGTSLTVAPIATAQGGGLSLGGSF